MLQLSELTFDPRALQARFRDQPIQLTENERGSPQPFFSNPDRIFSRERILNAVWGANADPLTSVVDV